MKKVLYFYGGQPNHPTEKGGEILRDLLARQGRYQLDMTDDPAAFASLPSSDYVAVVLYATKLYDALTPDREKGLLDFVNAGGGFVGLHSATDTFRDSRAFLEMLGGEFLVHPPGHFAFPMNVVDKEHYITARVPDFSLCEDQYRGHHEGNDQCSTTIDQRNKGRNR